MAYKKNSYKYKLNIIKDEDVLDPIATHHLCDDLMKIITEKQAKKIFIEGSVNWQAFWDDDIPEKFK